MTRDYTTSLAAQVTSTAGSADLSVVDTSATNTGKLANGSYVLEQPLQVKATNSANPNTVFAPVTGTPLALLSYPRAISIERGDARVQADRRRSRDAPRGRLHEDPEVHAVDHDSVI